MPTGKFVVDSGAALGTKDVGTEKGNAKVWVMGLAVLVSN